MKLNSRLLNLARKVETVFGFTLFFGFVAGVLAIIQAGAISRVISLVFLNGEILAHLTRLILAILIIILLRSAFSYAADMTASLAARKVKQDLQDKLFNHIINLGPNLLKSAHGSAETRTGELVNLALEGMDAIEIYFRQYLPQIGLAAVIPITVLIFVFPSDLLSGLILLVTAPLLPLFMYLIGSAAEKLTRKQWLGLSRMSAYFLDVLQGLTTLKTLGRSRDQIAVIQKVSENYRGTTMRVLKVSFISALVLELIATLSTAVVAVEIGLRLLYGRLAFEQAFFLLLLAPEFYQPLRLLGTRFHSGMSGVEAAQSIFQILDIPKPAEVLLFNSSQASIKEKTPPSIQIKGLSFSYPEHTFALKDINCEIPSGKITALVGESGAGKTTLTWLLLRFIQAQKGTVRVNGHILDKMPIAGWQASLAWVPQNPYLFNDTILANIKLAKPDAMQSEVLKAVQLAHADEFINEMPLGYQTIVGEHGVRLSAGQAQRIALARAFLKDASFIICDEATSHLDPEADRLIRDSLVSLAQGRTILVIAHHRATLSMAHQVITMNQGRIERIQSIQPTLTHASTHPVFQSPEKISKDSGYSESAISHGETNAEISIQKTSLERRLFRLITPFTGRILLSVILGFATVASGVGLMATAAYIISAAALHPSIADLQVAIVGVRFFGLSRGIFRYLERLVSHDVTFRLLARWRVWFYQALEPLAPARLLHYHSADLLTRVINDIGTLENFYVRSLAPPLVAFLVTLATLCIMYGFSTQIAASLFCFLLLAGVGLPLLAYRLSSHLGQQIAAVRKSLSIMLVDTIQGIADLLVYGQAKTHQNSLNQTSAKLNHLQFRLNGVASINTAVGILLSNLAMLAILVLAIQRVNLGQLDGVYLGVISLIALTCFEALQPLPMVAQLADSNRAAASRLYELVDAQPEVIDPSRPFPLAGSADLRVCDLAFKYPLSPEEVNSSSLNALALSGVSFSLPIGKHIALVGSNGSGKTTLVSLLLRFWEYQQGSIQMAGHEYRDYCQSDIRNQLAVISQDGYLFTATIRENLLIARPQASDEQIVQACRAAHLDGFIASLPGGLDTWIGEHGMRLSAGERQRLAIARAILKASPILILDEPTANLDPATELAVINSIMSLGQIQSSLTITQRMIGMEDMDQILVIKNGRIIEQGLHRQLLDSGGLYSQMWNLYHQEL